MPRITKLMRTVHLYTGLLLTPWLVVYGLSGLLLNHGPLVTAWLGRPETRFEVLSEAHFLPDEDLGQAPVEQAGALLRDLDLEGLYRVDRRSDARRLIVLRPSGGGAYRVTWDRSAGTVVVERQRPFLWRRLIHFLHFRHGYGQGGWVAWVWAAAVDAVTLSMLLWVISGIWLWARVPRTRRLGTAFLAAGLILFSVAAFLLCR